MNCLPLPLFVVCNYTVHQKSTTGRTTQFNTHEIFDTLEFVVAQMNRDLTIYRLFALYMDLVLALMLHIQYLNIALERYPR